VIYHKEESWAAPYIKAVIRDLKQYINARALRQIPVGYAATDLQEDYFEIGQFLNCGNDPMSRTDFYAINDYSWCSPTTFEQSGWKVKVEKLRDYGIPLLYVSLETNLLSSDTTL
jgi:hypothetical protein